MDLVKQMLENRKKAGISNQQTTHAPDQPKAPKTKAAPPLKLEPVSFSERRRTLIAEKGPRREIVKYLRELVESKMDDSSSDED